MLPIAELAINNYNLSLTRVSLFFLTYSYYMKPLQLLKDLAVALTQKSPIQQGEKIVQKLKQALD